MAFAADTGRITAALASAPASAVKTAFVTDITSLQAELENQTASLKDEAAIKLDDLLMKWAELLATELEDVS